LVFVAWNGFPFDMTDTPYTDSWIDQTLFHICTSVLEHGL